MMGLKVEIEAFDSDKNGGIVANIFIDGQNLAGLNLHLSLISILTPFDRVAA